MERITTGEKFEFILNLDYGENPYLKQYGLITNPFLGGGQTELEFIEVFGHLVPVSILEGLKYGIYKKYMKKFLKRLGLSDEAIALIWKNCKAKHKYKIAIYRKDDKWVMDIAEIGGD